MNLASRCFRSSSSMSFWLCAVIGMLVGCLVTSERLMADTDKRPNIVIIVADDMGFSDLGCYGSSIETPNLDRLAANGLRMVDFHNNAKCSETRASIMTGLWHQQSKNLAIAGPVTMAEVLSDSGYTTLMSGKWHLKGTPRERGFDRYFGFLSGAINFFTGLDWQSGENFMRLDDEVFEPSSDFYSTDAFTDYAIEFLEQARQNDQPYFLYLAHNAPHFPLHALPEDIAKYRGKFDDGWDVIRERRYQKMLKLGIIDERWRMSPRDSRIEPWDEVNDSHKKFLLPMVEVYAAMIDRLDQNIGRLVDNLEANGELDNTLIVFFSDNGACPYHHRRHPEAALGQTESATAYDARWANMCNTPLRLYKQYAHHGGTLTPMILHWPARIANPGSVSEHTGHIVDLMPTVVEVSGASYPVVRGERDVAPMEGVSLMPAIMGRTTSVQRPPIFWEYNGNHAIRDGAWKLVAERGKEWELYNVDEDRCETEDLAQTQPDEVTRLAEAYNAWAKRCRAVGHRQAAKKKPSSQSQIFDLDAEIAEQNE
ncbi:arylsulfatase [Rubripirellula amarantea]|nr:arylsulfatase [Rubripirellula amarantea]